jgi:hypothetical protein
VVRSGVVEGERVVVNGLQRIRPGVKVQVETVAMDLRPNGLTADATASAAVSSAAARGGK